ncbi:MAG: hypothetical protein ACOCOW_00895 [Prevotella sp.]
MNEFFHDATSLVRIAKSKDTKNSEQSLAIKKKLDVGVQKSHSLPSFFRLCPVKQLSIQKPPCLIPSGDEDKAAVCGYSTLAGSPPAR